MICTAILLVNLTGTSLVPEDIGHINRAQEVCRSRYKSCLVKIEKREPYVFHAYCGKQGKKYLIIDK